MHICWSIRDKTGVGPGKIGWGRQVRGDVFVCLFFSYRETEAKQEYWFTTQMPEKARAGPGQRLEPETQFRSSMWVKYSRHLSCHLLPAGICVSNALESGAEPEISLRSSSV